MKSKLLNRFKTRKVPVYAICIPGAPEETGWSVMAEICEILRDNGFSPFIRTGQGSILGYVYCNEDDKEKANECIKKTGAYLSEEPIDRAMKRWLTR